MLRTDWHKELVSFQERIQEFQDQPSQVHLLDQRIVSLVQEELLVISPELPMLDAMVKLLERDMEFALVQDSPDTILGVLRKEVIDDILVTSPSPPDTLTVRSIMDRNICIEPDSASVLEVLERMTLGGCPCTVIVDRNGNPASIISPMVLFQSLSKLVPASKVGPRPAFERVA